MLPGLCLRIKNSGHCITNKHRKTQKGEKKKTIALGSWDMRTQHREVPGFLTGSPTHQQGAAKSPTQNLQQAPKISKKSLFHLAKGPEIHGLTRILFGNTQPMAVKHQEEKLHQKVSIGLNRKLIFYPPPALPCRSRQLLSYSPSQWCE